ncbi:hypothetical protein, partial [Phenylobacterium sp.]|uniref:hypothetical protein n=1 Tax=Phenylobacterium sp. TaxID=1871053 RepID=UPI0025CF75F9
MSLSDVASIGTLLSAIAVLVSLIFLYFQLRQVSAQVRQTERNQRSIINQGATTRSMQTNSWLCEPHMSELLTKAMSNPLGLGFQRRLGFLDLGDPPGLVGHPVGHLIAARFAQ